MNGQYIYLDIIKEIKNKSFAKNALHCVFASIICKNGKPYSKYLEVKEEKDKETIIPMVLMINRWDGYMGFPGGKVDPKDYINGELSLETLKTGLKRELVEEIAFFDVDESKLEILCSLYHTNDNVYIHNFTYEVEYEEFKNIIKNSNRSIHFITEINSCFPVHLITYRGNKGLPITLKQEMCATSKYELLQILKKLDIKIPKIETFDKNVNIPYPNDPNTIKTNLINY